MATSKINNIPENVTVNLEGNVLIFTGEKGTLERKFKHPGISISCDNQKININTTSDRRKDKAVVGTWSAHINNMIYGVCNGYQYKLKIIYTHFPLNASFKDNKLIISNFMGEKGTRIADVVGDVKLDIQKEEITVSGIDKESVGQTAANIEQACKKGGRDIRIFQDGIYITKKG